jgi:hypothetical protein
MERRVGAFGADRNTGQERMSDANSPVLSGGGDDPHECAKQISDQITPLVKVARSKRFDFLAYLLAMAHRESQRLSRGGD